MTFGEREPDITSYTELSALEKLSREVRAAGTMLDRDQARFLVSLFYTLQDNRVALAAQGRELVAAEKPGEVVAHFFEQLYTLEKQMASVLDKWTASSVLGAWCRSNKGVGPILAASLMAHIDIERAPTVGHIWRFAGLDPSVTWGKGEKRPWNADLKVTTWKLGDCFVKTSGYDDAFYGKIYRERKALEVERNEAGLFSDTAARSLVAKKIVDKKTRAIYESGKLPPGRLDLRARRVAVKLFLAHYHHVAYIDHYGTEPPKPYILTKEGGHAHYIAPPNWPLPN